MKTIFKSKILNDTAANALGVILSLEHIGLEPSEIEAVLKSACIIAREYYESEI